MIPKIATTWTEYKQNLYLLPLPDCISVTVTETLNGAFDLAMTYPIGGQFAEKLEIEEINSGISPIISAVPRKGANEEPFRIYETSKALDGLINVKAHHIVYDTDGIIIEPFTATGISSVINALNTHWNGVGAEFLVQNNGIVDNSTVFDSKEPATLFSLIGAVAEAFGAELSYTYDSFTSRVLIKLNASRGSVKTTVVGYGVNMISATKTVNNESVYNNIYAYAAQENDDGTVTIVSNDGGAIVFNGRNRTLLVDVSSDYDGLPTAAQIGQDILRYSGQQTNQKRSANVNFVPLEDTTEGYGTSNLTLGDTVTVSADPLGMTTTAKVVQTVFNPLNGKYDSISVGSLETTIADTIVQATTPTTSESRLMAVGQEPMSSVAAGATTTSTVSFGKTFGAPPVVFVSLFSSQTNGLGQCSASVYNITTTGFSLRLTNGYSAARNLGAAWLAMRGG